MMTAIRRLSNCQTALICSLFTYPGRTSDHVGDPELAYRTAIIRSFKLKQVVNQDIQNSVPVSGWQN